MPMLPPMRSREGLLVCNLNTPLRYSPFRASEWGGCLHHDSCYTLAYIQLAIYTCFILVSTFTILRTFCLLPAYIHFRVSSVFRLTDCSFVLPASSGRLRLRLVVWNVPICSCVSRKRTHNGAKPRLRRCTSPRPHTTRTHTARSAAPCAALWHAARLFAAAATTCRRHAQPHASNAKKCMLMHMPQADGGTHARVPSHVSSPRRPPDMLFQAVVVGEKENARIWT